MLCNLLAEGAARKPLRREVIRGLQNIVGAPMVLHRAEDLLLYEYDGSVEKGRPGAVLFPSSTEDVSRVVRLAALELLAEKMSYASATKAQVIATSNPGCLLRMRAGAEIHHTGQQVLHVIEVLDQAITN
jgi:hypothetical protein